MYVVSSHPTCDMCLKGTRGGSYACLSCVRVLAVVFLLEGLNPVLGK